MSEEQLPNEQSRVGGGGQPNQNTPDGGTARQVHALNPNNMGRGWFMFIGIIITIIGILAVILPGLGTIGATLFIGWLLLFAGIVEVVNGFVSQRGWHALWLIVIGVVTVIAGGLLIFEPIQGAYAVTIVLSFYFLFTGGLRLAVGTKAGGKHGGWVVVSGVINLFLAGLIWAFWPSDALWVPGLIVGIDLIFAGWSMMMLGSIPVGMFVGDLMLGGTDGRDGEK
ncbi:HdeD family acid-resistance protein [Poriferisphaera sp. WC338]|uniref:HdeD family acid-resistance protein n=1 Tax=Poriferisphaera sp. WC338 TaxID=3425129 RepID=UPI003D81C485